MRRSTLRRWVAATIGLALLLVPAVPVTAAEDFQEAYLEALAQLANGDEVRALELLLGAETAAAPAGAEREIDAVTKRELAVARRLASRNVESLVPIARLHQRAYHEHLEARRLRLAVHSRQLVVELVDLYRVGSGRPDAERVASELLTSLGGSVQSASMASVAIALYELAVELEPSNVTALMGLANVFERQGSYRPALARLERVLEVEPSHREATLRRGILLLRLGRDGEGAGSLQALIDRETEDWILSLAYQELARSSSRSGNHERARELLLEARERLPEDPSLPVQIAYLQDRTRAPVSPESLAAALRDSAASPHPSPRSLYNQTTGASLEGLRRTLDESSRHRLADLATGLRAAGYRGGAP